MTKNKNQGAKSAPNPSKKKKNGKKNKKTTTQMNSTNQLSPCARDYAFSLRDPFDGPLACVPSSYPPIPTLKMRIFSRGIGTIGTAGYGFVMVVPRRMAANDIGGAYYSGATFPDAKFPASLSGTGVSVANSNAPFAYAALGSGTPTSVTAQYRIVSVGVRSWFTGTELNVSGESMGFRHPDNDSIVGLTYSDLLAFDSTRRVSESSARPVLETLWIPVKPTELEFVGTIDDVAPLGHLRAGVAGQTFSWECYALMEYIGRSVPGKSSSHADPAGFAAVLTAAQNEGDTWIGSARAAGASLVNAASRGLSALSGAAGTFASKNGANLVSAAASMAVRYAMGDNAGMALIGNTDPSSGRSRKGPLVEEVEAASDMHPHPEREGVYSRLAASIREQPERNETSTDDTGMGPQKAPRFTSDEKAILIRFLESLE